MATILITFGVVYCVLYDEIQLFASDCYVACDARLLARYDAVFESIFYKRNKQERGQGKAVSLAWDIELGMNIIA